jgi:hypothetical protein
MDLMSSGERRRQIRRERACADEDDAASGWDEPDHQRPVGDDAHTLEIALADRLRISEHTLSDAQQIAIRPCIERTEKRLELRLHLGLAGKRRSKPADNLEKDCVRVAVSDERVV